jgi:hypothetical protein
VFQVSFDSLPPPPKKQAEADLDPAELQDLVDALPDILKAGAGLNLRFVLRLELKDGEQVPEKQIAKLNDALGKASPKLKFG